MPEIAVGERGAAASLPRIPPLNPAGGRRVLGELRGCGPVNLGDDRRGRAFEECLDLASGRHKRSRQVREWGLADYYQEPDPVPDDCCAFVRLVADASVMGESYPFALSDLCQPLFVGTVGSEVIRVSFEGEARALQDLREAGAEIAIGEEDKRQAARS